MELEEIKGLKWRAELDIANIMSEFEKKMFAEKYLRFVSDGSFSYYGDDKLFENDFRKKNNSFEIKEYDLED